MRHPGFGEGVRLWLEVGLNSFGGPAGQIAVMHRKVVEERAWVSEERFLHALNYCMMLPGPEAQQLATYLGWLLHRTPGGIVAGTLFVLPGCLAMLLLCFLYAGFREVPAVEALFFGLKPAVLAVVVEALVRIGRRAFAGRAMALLAAGAFAAIFFADIPFPLILGGAALLGLVAGRCVPGVLARPSGPASGVGVVDALLDQGALEHTRPSLFRAVRVTAVCLALWWGPVALAAWVWGTGHVFVRQGLFFSQAAVVTFGGAYAVLSYLAQEAVHTYRWVTPIQMVDGLGLAETTPGPLILVVQFVAFMGAFGRPAGMNPWVAGTLGALLTVWVTFLPSFLWIFLGGPYVEALRGVRWLSHALAAITAAVVGVIANLAVWFALHVLFARVAERRAWGLRLWVPDPGSLDLAAAALAALSTVAIFRWKLGMLKTLALSAALGLAWRMLALGR